MKDVIDLNKYKTDKKNEVLIYLKQRVEDKGKAEKVEFFKYWSKYIIFSGIFQFLFSLIITFIVKRNIILKSMINFILCNILIWIILEITQKCTGSVIRTNHFKIQKELVLWDKKVDMTRGMTYFYGILWSNYDIDLDVSYLNICERDYSSLLSFINSDNYKEFKSGLQKVNNEDYLKLIKIEKDLDKMNNEITILSDVTKQDLKKLS